MTLPDPAPPSALSLRVPNPAPLSELAALLLEEEAAARAARATGLPRGPVTGFAGLDEELGGFLSPGIHSLLAAPGAGKTSFAAQIAAHCGCPALFVTCEMRPVELLRRAVAREAGPYLQRLRGGELSEEALAQHLETAARACPRLAVYDATAQQTGAQAIQEAAKPAPAPMTQADTETVHMVMIRPTRAGAAGAASTPPPQPAQNGAPGTSADAQRAQNRPAGAGS